MKKKKKKEKKNALKLNGRDVGERTPGGRPVQESLISSGR